MDNVEEYIKLIVCNPDKVVKIDDDSYLMYDSVRKYLKYGENPIYSKSRMERHLEKMNKIINGEWGSTSININRFNILYSKNDKLINYLRTLKLKRVYLIGNMSDELYNYINVYGNDFETVISDKTVYDCVNLEEGEIIIDTDSFGQEIKKIVNPEYNKKNIFNINYICSMCEYYYFATCIYPNKKMHVSVFEYPNNNDFDYLSDEEKERMKSKMEYTDYISNWQEYRPLLHRFFKETYDEERLMQFDDLPGTILVNGVCRLGDSSSKIFNTINGYRNTTNKNNNYTYDINIFGPCVVYGMLVDDQHTISSYMQRRVNEENLDYSVNNYGLRALDFSEQVRIFDSINVKEGDHMIFFLSESEAKKIRTVGFDDIIQLKYALNVPDLHDFFLDNPTHCNHEANERISDSLFNTIRHNLKQVGNNTTATIDKTLKRNIFSSNAFLDEYSSFLKSLNVSGSNNGSILINANPFTYGHYNLIKYASSMVDQMIVFVVEDDKSEFSFEDRYNMVVEGCKEFDNVIVVPSGKIFGSSMIFPEYYKRSEETNIELDLSLDQEIFCDYIAPLLNIKYRFIGTEPNDVITNAYSRQLKMNLPLKQIEVIEVPRFKVNGENISAKEVRKALDFEDYDRISKLVPASTLYYILDNKIVLRRKHE